MPADRATLEASYVAAFDSALEATHRPTNASTYSKTVVPTLAPANNTTVEAPNKSAIMPTI